MNKITPGKRLRYWLERRMAKGTSSMVKLLLCFVLFMVVLVTVLVLLLNLKGSEKNHLALFWDNLRAAMSSSFPSSDSGTLVYVILYTLLGLTGMIITGMLIGIFSTYMRGKILKLQTENPEILEKDHVVVLGFRSGEYALLSQLMQAAWGGKRTLVVVDKMERVDMDRDISTNLKIPKNIRLVVINADTDSAASIRCCNIEAASTVVINTRDKGRTVKTFLALNTLLLGAERRPKIVATVNTDPDEFPNDLLSGRDVFSLHSTNIVARIIAHAAAQPGIFDAFLDMIDFNNFEFYFEERPPLYGVPFWKAVLSSSNGIVAGIYRDGSILLNPDPDTIIRQGDQLAVFEEEQGDVRFKDTDSVQLPERQERRKPAEIPEVVIFGVNAAIATIIQELPDNIAKIRLAGLTERDFQYRVLNTKAFTPNIEPDYRNTDSEDILADMVREASHLIVLSDRKKRDEEADAETMIRIMRLRKLKRERKLGYTITAEMRCENNRRLIDRGGEDDIVVASDLSSTMLAQVTEEPRRLLLFNVLLDEEGSEVYLRPISEFGLEPGQISVRDLRKRVYAYGYIPMGIRTKENAFKVLDDNIQFTLAEEDRLILLGEE